MTSNSNSNREAEIGSYLMALGGVIVTGSAAALPDTTVGSPRQVGTALGALFVAIGGFLLARAHS